MAFVPKYGEASMAMTLWKKLPSYLSTKNTIMKKYDGRFKDIVQEVQNWKDKFEQTFNMFIEESYQSLHDAIMIVRRAMKNSTVVAGDGEVDMEISRYLWQHARNIGGKSQVFINAFAKALEVIPRQLCGRFNLLLL